MTTEKHQSKGRRFTIVAILLVVIAGLGTAAGLVMVNRSDDSASDSPQYVVMDVASTTPVFEPRDAAGNDPFYPLPTQLLKFQEEAEEQIDEQMAEAQANADPGDTVIRPEFDVAALDAAVKTGLYGGTEENTCDPERLISFLYANPDIGEAWAKVQGIEFVEIADYIRSLEVRVLAEPVNVLNHGYDGEIGAAYEIDTVLDAGTAVLVDENGDVRTRCYCGNPIKPKPPEHMPPRCLVFGSLVFTEPAGSTKREDVARDVLLTGRQTTFPNGANWVEVKWGTGDNQVGWTQANNLRKSYCPTPTSDRFCPGPGATNVWHSPDMTSQVGQVTGEVRTHDTTLDIFAPINPVGGIGNETIVNDFMLIRFKESAPSVQDSAWVKLADLNQDNSECFRIRQCVDTDGPVRDRAGGGLLAPDGIRWVEFTGHFIGQPLVKFAEVRLNNGSGNYGWISNFYTPLPDSECEPPIYDCIEQAVFYESANQVLPAFLGQLANVTATIIGGPENGRVEIQIDAPTGPTGWVETGSFYDGHGECDWPPSCANTSGLAWTEFATNGISTPADATPRMIGFNGAYVEDGGIGYTWISDGGTNYWIDVADLNSLAPERCEPGEPTCSMVEKGPIAEFTPTIRDLATLDLATESREIMTDDDAGYGYRDVCCVDALYNSRNIADVAADPVPRWVVVVNTSDLGGVVWFETLGSRFFRQADIVSADECERPACPEATPLPGRDELIDSILGLGDEVRLIDGSAVDTSGIKILEGSGLKGLPGRPVANGECCVTQLFAGMGVGEVALLTPAWVEVASGPHGNAPSWYQTTDGWWFPETAVTNDDNCRRQTNCPTDDPTDDPGGPSSGTGGFPGERDDDLTYGSMLFGEPTEDSTDTVILATTIDALGGIRTLRCCVSGDIYDMPEGDVKGNLPPTMVLMFDQAGDWFGFLIDGPLGNGWAPSAQFLPLEDCKADGGCPESSMIDVVAFAAGEIDICCIALQDAAGATFYEAAGLTGETRDGADGLEYERNDGTWIPEGSFVDAKLCDEDIECPVPGSIISPNDPLTCCVNFGNAGFDIVTLTGEVREGANGEPEYEATDGVWYQDFANAGRCGADSTPCDGTIIDNQCCERPNEVFQGQCVPPCPRGQERNSNGDCYTPEVTCPTGQVKNVNGVCVTPEQPCPTGQVRVAGACVTPPCENNDDDTICDSDDNCDFNTNEDQADSDRDGFGDKCDPCTDADQDTFCEIPGDNNNDNCWGLFNTLQEDFDLDGVGDLCDNCPRTSNSDQANSDGLGTGDACEEPACPRSATGAPGDLDGDGICNDDDNCLRVPNPGQSDRDDFDGYGDACDNCPDTYNPQQADTNGNGIGDACESSACGQGDDDSDGVCNGEDNCFNVPNVNQDDKDDDGVGDPCDICPFTYNPDQQYPYAGNSCTPLLSSSN